jgi:hypothetical protein
MTVDLTITEPVDYLTITEPVAATIMPPDHDDCIALTRTALNPRLLATEPTRTPPESLLSVANFDSDENHDGLFSIMMVSSTS